MIKAAQYQDYGQQRSVFDEILGKATSPLATGLGLAAAYYGGKHLWRGSPELRMAALVGLPAALVKYMHYREPMNLAKAQTETTKKFYDQVKQDPNSQFYDPEVLQHIQMQQRAQLMQDYGSPMRSGLKDALPYFALGAALPTAIQLLR